MDWQHLFDITLGVLSTILIYLWKSLLSDHSALEKEVREHREYALINFANKKDMTEHFDKLENLLKDISNKIDTKQDKKDG